MEYSDRLTETIDEPNNEHWRDVLESVGASYDYDYGTGLYPGLASSAMGDFLRATTDTDASQEHQSAPPTNPQNNHTQHGVYEPRIPDDEDDKAALSEAPSHYSTSPPNINEELTPVKTPVEEPNDNGAPSAMALDSSNEPRARGANNHTFNIDNDYAHNDREDAKQSRRLNIIKISKNAKISETIELERPQISLEELTDSLDLSDIWERPDTTGVGTAQDLFRTYEDEVFPMRLGEGGREFIRAALMVYYISGGGGDAGTKGANLAKLVTLANQAGLWNLVQRCKIERLQLDPSPIYLRFIKFMSDKKRFVRSTTSSIKKVKRYRTPDEFLQYFNEHGELPAKFTLSDGGRTVIRQVIRTARNEDKALADKLFAEQHLKFTQLSSWTNTSLTYILELFGPRYVQAFCYDWANTVSSVPKKQMTEYHKIREVIRDIRERGISGYRPSEHEEEDSPLIVPLLQSTRMPEVSIYDNAIVDTVAIPCEPCAENLSPVEDHIESIGCDDSLMNALAEEIEPPTLSQTVTAVQEKQDKASFVPTEFALEDSDDFVQVDNISDIGSEWSVEEDDTGELIPAVHPHLIDLEDWPEQTNK